MSTDTIPALVTVASLTITILASSTFAAQFFTDFDIDSEKLADRGIVNVKNIGLVQANNAVLQIISTGPINDYVDRCAEGEVEGLINNETLVVKFFRISPATDCRIELVVSEPVSFRMTVNSDGRLTQWKSWDQRPTVYHLVAALIGLIIAELLVFASIIRVSQNNEVLNCAEFWLRNKWRGALMKDRFKKTPNTENTIKFVWKEYELKINSIDATILELIYLQKTTMAQLKKYSRLSLRQVKYRVWSMRRIELISKDKMELDKELYNYFVYPRLGNYVGEPNHSIWKRRVTVAIVIVFVIAGIPYWFNSI